MIAVDKYIKTLDVFLMLGNHPHNKYRTKPATKRPKSKQQKLSRKANRRK